MNARNLGSTSVNELPPEIEVPNYDRDAVVAGVVHIGVGNFHRAHQAAYFDDLLKAGHLNWGIVGVSLRSSSTRDALAAQDGLYTLVEQGIADAYRVIGTLKGVLVAPEAPDKTIDALAAETTELITVTITESGYLLNATGIDVNNASIQADSESLEAPKSVYGYIAAALTQRARTNVPPVTVLCCDNVRKGGETLQLGTEYLLRAHHLFDERWQSQNVSFISSVVDRVTPLLSNALIAKVEKTLGVRDAWPVATEPFRFWVIEDNFVGTRPPLDKVGALFVNDVAAFEHMKLACLNAAHSVIAIIGYLLGHEYVHDALEDPALYRFVRTMLVDDVLPVTTIPSEIDGADYVAEVMQRFENASLPYQNTQVCNDSSQKIQQRWFPTIDALVNADRDTSRFAFALAAWIVLVQGMLTSEEAQDQNRDQLIAAVRTSRTTSEIVQNTLAIAGSGATDFASDQSLIDSITKILDDIYELGIDNVLVCLSGDSEAKSPRS